MKKKLFVHDKGQQARIKKDSIIELRKRGVSDLELQELGFITNILWSRTKVEELLKTKKYKNIKAWQKDNGSSYMYAYKQDWYPQICSKYFKNKRIEWSKDKIEEILKTKGYKNIGAWQKDGKGSYLYAYKQDWYETIVTKYKLRQRK